MPGLTISLEIVILRLCLSVLEGHLTRTTTVPKIELSRRGETWSIDGKIFNYY